MLFSGAKEIMEGEKGTTAHHLSSCGISP